MMRDQTAQWAQKSHEDLYAPVTHLLHLGCVSSTHEISRRSIIGGTLRERFMSLGAASHARGDQVSCSTLMSSPIAFERSGFAREIT